LSDELHDLPTSDDEQLLHQQFLRAVSSLEGIILSQIEMKNKLSSRLNYSIQAGLLILGIIAISILILLWTLSSQIHRISDVVDEMNTNFSTVSLEMKKMENYITSMEGQVGLLQTISGNTKVMQSSIKNISSNMVTMEGTVGGISAHVNSVRVDVHQISQSMDHMDNEVINMRKDLQDMSEPSRRMNDFFPFP
jgi:methyl-accepting chemotaxis protein